MAIAESVFRSGFRLDMALEHERIEMPPAEIRDLLLADHLQDHARRATRILLPDLPREAQVAEDKGHTVKGPNAPPSGPQDPLWKPNSKALRSLSKRLCEFSSAA